MVASLEGKKGPLRPKRDLGKIARAAAFVSLVAMGPATKTDPDANKRFDVRHVASEQLKKTGITAERKEAQGTLSNALARGLSPFRYSKTENKESRWHENIVADVNRIMKGVSVGFIRDENQAMKSHMIQDIKNHFRVTDEKAERIFDARMDAFRLYLGLPQKHDTFGVSDFKPVKSKQDKFYYKINNFLENFEEVAPGTPRTRGEALLPERREQVLEWLWMSAHGYDGEFGNEDRGSGIMGQYTLSRGQDERGLYVSYYDKWDLGGSIEGVLEGGIAGKPFEIYDRIYIEDPDFLKKLEESTKLSIEIKDPDELSKESE